MRKMIRRLGLLSILLPLSIAHAAERDVGNFDAVSGKPLGASCLNASAKFGCDITTCQQSAGTKQTSYFCHWKAVVCPSATAQDLAGLAATTDGILIDGASSQSLSGNTPVPPAGASSANAQATALSTCRQGVATALQAAKKLPDAANGQKQDKPSVAGGTAPTVSDTTQSQPVKGQHGSTGGSAD